MRELLSELQNENLILYTENKLDKDINLNGTNISIIDENTCEVSLSTDSNINQLIEELSKQGIKVKSLKNKTSRLEELFIRMVDKNGKNNLSLQKTAYSTIVRKEVLRFSRIWKQTLIPPVITNILYFIIFGNLIGERIEKSTHLPIPILFSPGLLMSVITHSYTNTVSSLYISKYHRYIEELLVSPIQNYTILAGFITGGVIRGLAVGIVVILAAQFFVNFTVHNIILMLIVIFLSSTLFSMCGFLNGLFANDWDDINVIPTFIMTH